MQARTVEWLQEVERSKREAQDTVATLTFIEQVFPLMMQLPEVSESQLRYVADGWRMQQYAVVVQLVKMYLDRNWSSDEIPAELTALLDNAGQAVENIVWTNG